MELREKIEKYKKLMAQILKWDHEYHINHRPSVPDKVYDMTFRQLKELHETLNNTPIIQRDIQEEVNDLFDKSPISKVGADLSKCQTHRAKVKHLSPMWSLDNAFDVDDILKFAKRCEKEGATIGGYVVEPKYDGLSIELIYDKMGFLESAITRGDGEIGEDVTENAFALANIPKALRTDFNGKVSVKGEVIIPKAKFAAINAELEKQGEKPFANTRNLAAGTMRQSDANIVVKRGAQFWAWDLLEIGSTPTGTRVDLSKLMQANRFDHITPHPCRNIPDIMESIHFIQDPNLVGISYPFDIDGAVVKVNSISHITKMGYTSKSPKAMIAYKYESEGALSTVLEIIEQVGRHGAITPVAKIEPVTVQGATVSSPTLHNFDEIDRLGIYVGAQVRVVRSGEVIPKIVEVLNPDRSKVRPRPTKCPSCGTDLSYTGREGKGEGVVLFCNNKYCPEQLVQTVIHYCSRDAANIMGLADKTIRKLVGQHVVKSVIDLYKLSVPSFSGVTSGDVTPAKIIAEISKAKRLPLERFLYAIGIPEIGKSTAKTLAKQYKAIENLLAVVKSCRESVVALIGASATASLEDWLRDNYTEEEGWSLYLNNLLARVQIEEVEESVSSGAFLGKAICITGTLLHPREHYEAIIKQNGGTFVTSVTKTTDFLLVGEEAGSKVQKAEKYGIKTLSESEFHAMISKFEKGADDEIRPR